MQEQIYIYYNPFPAVRVNGKGGRFTARAEEYHNHMQSLRDMINNLELLESIMNLLLSGDYCLVFYMPMPKSWSKKKRKAMHLQGHKQTPDLDNLYKAFTDTVFYKQDKNDSAISVINAVKIWSDVGKIGLCNKSR